MRDAPDPPRNLRMNHLRPPQRRPPPPPRPQVPNVTVEFQPQHWALQFEGPVPVVHRVRQRERSFLWQEDPDIYSGRETMRRLLMEDHENLTENQAQSLIQIKVPEPYSEEGDVDFREMSEVMDAIGQITHREGERTLLIMSNDLNLPGLISGFDFLDSTRGHFSSVLSGEEIEGPAEMIGYYSSFHSHPYVGTQFKEKWKSKEDEILEELVITPNSRTLCICVAPWSDQLIDNETEQLILSSLRCYLDSYTCTDDYSLGLKWETSFSIWRTCSLITTKSENTALNQVVAAMGSVFRKRIFSFLSKKKRLTNGELIYSPSGPLPEGLVHLRHSFREPSKREPKIKYQDMIIVRATFENKWCALNCKMGYLYGLFGRSCFKSWFVSSIDWV